MADEVFRPQRPNSAETPVDIPENHPLRQNQGVNALPAGAVTGNIPPQFRAAMAGMDAPPQTPLLLQHSVLGHARLTDGPQGLFEGPPVGSTIFIGSP